MHGCMVSTPTLLRLPMHPHVARHTHWSASFVNRTPLLRFCPLQRSLAALRCPWLPCLRTIPLRRFATCRRPARPRKSPAMRRPCGFTLLGLDAVVLECGPCYRLRCRRSQFASAEANRTTRTQVSRSMAIRASESGESDSLALANDPSRQASPLCQSAASCRVMHRRVSWRGVPLPRRKAFAAWPDDGSFPLAHSSLFARRRSWGSFL